ncbi:hypothetical protein ACHAWF_017074 [Thalassiosira exigua]
MAMIAVALRACRTIVLLSFFAAVDLAAFSPGERPSCYSPGPRRASSDDAAGRRSRRCIRAVAVPRATSRPLFDEVDEGDVRDLPIRALLDSIRDSLREKPCLLLEAASGAGKTTVVPLLLSSLASTSDDDDASRGLICVEPRRVAARSAAQRMAKLIDRPVGDSVGYAIRGESRQSAKTSVLVMTDGVLLRILREDPELTGYDTVILDEFHERGLGSDTALALLREVQLNYRPDLKIVVMSATLLGSAEEEGDEISAGAKLRTVLGGEGSCNVLRSEGRQYPITIQHSRRTSPRHAALFRDTKLLVKTMADAIEEGLSRAPDKGDILAFLPGAKEINRAVQELKSRGLRDVDVFPLYGALPKPEQDRAIYRGDSDVRRVIVSSPIAEASLTIEGVTCVVDSGLQRQPRYDANTGLPRLVTVACSRDSAVQRAGRAGRTREGYCLRLFSEAEFDKLSQHITPEILSTDLIPTTLLLSDWGCTSAHDIDQVPFIDPPPLEALNKAYQILEDLDALEDYRLSNSRRKRYKMTDHGRALVSLATHPRLATSIIKASEKDEASLAAAVTTAALIDREFRFRESNLALNIREVLNGGPGTPNGQQLLNFASRVSEMAKSAVMSALSGRISSLEVSDVAGTALLPGFIDLIAQRKGEASYGGSTYMLSLGQSARLDDKQNEGEYIIVVETFTGDDGKARIKAYSKIDPSALHDIASEEEEVYTVPSKGYQVRKRRVNRVGHLILSSKTMPSPTSEETTNALLDTMLDVGGIPALIAMQPKKVANQLAEMQKRIALARECASEDEHWPRCFASLDAIIASKGTHEDERILLDIMEPWLGAASSLKGLNLMSILETQLSVEQQNQIDHLFPTSITAPDGTDITITYDSDTGPVASAKLQQFFGQRDSPIVGPPERGIPVSLSLLSPSGKPLAQTIDLPFFWRETYPSVRAEMRGRYPKHPWPEDPLTAVPSRLTKKQQQVRSPSNGKNLSDERKKERIKPGKRRK